MKKILFVCTGNICRSPSAEAVFRHKVVQAGRGAEFEVDSVGTHGYHVGETPDQRAMNAAQQRGIDMGGITARKVSLDDFDVFDYLIAMDQGHLETLKRLQPSGSRAQVVLFLDYAQAYKGQDVPDPYYGDRQGFDDVLDLLECGVEEMLHVL